MVKKRRLGDLFVTGRLVTVNDGAVEVDGSMCEPIQVWVQKLNPIEQENALRRASVERAKYLAVVKDHESELWQSVWADLHEFAPSKEQLLPVALRDDIAKIRTRVEAECAAEEEWIKDDYLQSLFDAWTGTARIQDEETEEPTADEDEEPTERSKEGDREPLKVSWLRGPEDPRYVEADKIWQELQRFQGQVSTLVDGERERLFRDYADTPLEEIRDLAVEKMLEQNASTAMLGEFETQELFYAVRDPDNHSKKYFGSRDEVASLQPEVRRTLVDTYRAIIVEPIEGKDSPGIPGSSPSSDSSAPEATATSSGPVGVPA